MGRVAHTPDAAAAAAAADDAADAADADDADADAAAAADASQSHVHVYARHATRSVTRDRRAARERRDLCTNCEARRSLHADEGTRDRYRLRVCFARERRDGAAMGA